MPTSKIEAELLKATKLDSDDYKKRQEMLEAILNEVNAFDDKKWNKMTEPAQLWVNAAIKAAKAEKRLPEFPDVGEVKPGADDDEDEEKPAKKKAKKAEESDDEDDEKPAKKKKAKPAADEDDDDGEDDDEDEKPAKKKKAKPADDEDEDEDEDEKPAKKKKAKPAEDADEDDEKPAKKKKAAKSDDEDDDEDEKPAKKKAKPKADDDDEDEKPAKKKAKKAEAGPPPKASGVKVAIKDAIIEDPEISVDSIVKKLGKHGADVSKVTVSNVRAEFRHSLKLLQERGKLKGLSI